MTVASKVDSNATSLSIAEESTIGVLPGTPVWYPFEPNEYTDFGANTTTRPRKPISSDRQRRKGPLVDLDGVGGFSTDVTQVNLQRLMRGYLFATQREKALYGADSLSGITISGITAIDDTFAVASGGASCDANDLVFGAGFTNSDNNGLHTVSSSTGTTVVVSSALVDETPPSTATLTRVGHVFATGDAEIDSSGDLPTLITTTKDLTELDLVPGEFIFIGGDTAGTKFATAANNGFARVRSVSTNAITLDKSAGTMVTDDGSGKTIQIFFGRVIKNESDPDNQVRRTFQLERTLGSPDDANVKEQAEYVIGAVPSECVFNIPSADAFTADLSFIAIDHGTNDQDTDKKSGTRPALVAADAYNTSSEVPRIKLAAVSSTNSNPTSLVDYVQELTLTINNNISLNKAVGTLGGFDASAGTIDVSASLTAYFNTVAVLAAKRANTDLTLDLHLSRENAGISIDIPLIGISGGIPEVASDEPITLPLDVDAGAGIDVHANLNHTILISFFDYLPSAAAA